MADDKQKPEIDERWMGEWLAKGFAEMHIYLVKQAQFDQWCQRHPKPEENTDAS